MQTFDSYIFDMDGTLWDAVDSYCAIWNKTIADLGVDVEPVTRKTLINLMGTPLDGIFDVLIGEKTDRDIFIPALKANSEAIMPRSGGRLYPGVTETLTELAGRARLFMVSNCDEATLETFLDFTGLRPLMTEWLSFGATGKEKDTNIATLVEKYDLKNPVYIGDTAGDLHATHAAGLPFAWAAYGFGNNITGAEYTLNSIADLL